ncbi:MAG: hypothetical protein AB7K09_00385 [Planctomycetota bacterium]
MTTTHPMASGSEQRSTGGSTTLGLPHLPSMDCHRPAEPAAPGYQPSVVRLLPLRVAPAATRPRTQPGTPFTIVSVETLPRRHQAPPDQRPGVRCMVVQDDRYPFRQSTNDDE